jgi:hypothetical protein
MPATSFTRVNATDVDMFTNAATLDSPGEAASSASNSKSSITTFAAPDAMLRASPLQAIFAFFPGS